MSFLTSEATVTVEIDGISYGLWDSRTGGDTEAPDTRYRPGGFNKTELVLGGPRTVTNVTLGRIYDLTEASRVITLRNKVGRGNLTVREERYDENGVPYGASQTWKGKLIRVQSAEFDSTGDDAAMVEIEVAVVSDVV